MTSSFILPPSSFKKGFAAGKAKMTRLPSQFFTDLLPQIDHLG
jgi:hypothetical protein